MPQLSEKLHLGVQSRNQAWNQGPNVPNSTTVLGLRAAEHLERVRSRYTQKERDTESNNDYFFARYYNSALGRFTTPDWSAKTDPVPYAVFTDPQSLNLYAYVRNNPITRVDVDGHGPNDPPCNQILLKVEAGKNQKIEKGHEEKGKDPNGKPIKIHATGVFAKLKFTLESHGDRIKGAAITEHNAPVNKRNGIPQKTFLNQAMEPLPSNLDGQYADTATMAKPTNSKAEETSVAADLSGNRWEHTDIKRFDITISGTEHCSADFIETMSNGSGGGKYQFNSGIPKDGLPLQ